jgi:signal transduction histidine kinase
LNIVNNEVKYKADVVKQYGDIPDIECLPSQINQVVMNMVVNAAHAIKGKRGAITVSTGAEGENVWIKIADNGCGIPKENLLRIFDPFFTTKPIGTGTGLGLSLSYGIVQKHRGSIEVESEVGAGTTFCITLPIRHSALEDGAKDAGA